MNTARNEEISRPQTSSDCSAASLTEKWRQRTWLLLRCPQRNCQRPACNCRTFQQEDLFQCFVPVIDDRKTNARVGFTATNTWIDTCSSLCSLPSTITFFCSENVVMVYFYRQCARESLSYDLHLNLAFLFLSKPHIFGTQINLSSLMAGMDTFPFYQVCLCKVFLPSPSLIWKTQCIAYMNWRVLRWVDSCFGIIWLLRRPFSSSHFFKSRSKPFDCFSKLGMANSLDLTCMTVFLTSLNIDLTSGDPICTISNILCMQLGK